MGRQGRARGRLAAVVVITALAVGGCTSNADISGATLAPLSSSTSQTSSTVTSNQPTTSGTPSSAVGSTEAPSVDPTTASSDTVVPIEGDWPTSFTAEQVAMAPEALSALTTGWEVIQLMYGDPAVDRSVQLNASVADPLRTRVTIAAGQMTTSGEHKDNADQIEPIAASATGSGEPGSGVLFNVCLDSSQSVVRDAAGNEVRRTAPELVRVLYKASVLKYGDGSWLMDSFSPAEPFTAC